MRTPTSASRPIRIASILAGTTLLCSIAQGDSILVFEDNFNRTSATLEGDTPTFGNMWDKKNGTATNMSCDGSKLLLSGNDQICAVDISAAVSLAANPDKHPIQVSAEIENTGTEGWVSVGLANVTVTAADGYQRWALYTFGNPWFIAWANDRIGAYCGPGIGPAAPNSYGLGSSGTIAGVIKVRMVYDPKDQIVEFYTGTDTVPFRTGNWTLGIKPTAVKNLIVQAHSYGVGTIDNLKVEILVPPASTVISIR